jgi:hypothetical protein
MKRKLNLPISVLCGLLIPTLNIYILTTRNIEAKINYLGTMILFAFIFTFTNLEGKTHE